MLMRVVFIEPLFQDIFQPNLVELCHARRCFGNGLFTIHYFHTKHKTLTMYNGEEIMRIYYIYRCLPEPAGGCTTVGEIVEL